MQYLTNLRRWAGGFAKLGTIQYRPGWNAWKFFPVYLFDVGFNVIVMAGSVQTFSGFMERHRDAWVWDEILDGIEQLDPQHGLKAGPALWGTAECGPWMRRLVPACWLALLVLAW